MTLNRRFPGVLLTGFCILGIGFVLFVMFGGTGGFAFLSPGNRGEKTPFVDTASETDNARDAERSTAKLAPKDVITLKPTPPPERPTRTIDFPAKKSER